MGNDDISGEIQKWVAKAGEGQDYGRRWWGGGVKELTGQTLDTTSSWILR